MGFDVRDPLVALHNQLVFRVASPMQLAHSRGFYPSSEHSVVFYLGFFILSRRTGSFAWARSCLWGSGSTLNVRSLSGSSPILQSPPRCVQAIQGVAVVGTFDPSAGRAPSPSRFRRGVWPIVLRGNPAAPAVFGREPRRSEAVAPFSGSCQPVPFAGAATSGRPAGKMLASVPVAARREFLGRWWPEIASPRVAASGARPRRLCLRPSHWPMGGCRRTARRSLPAMGRRRALARPRRPAPRSGIRARRTRAWRPTRNRLRPAGLCRRCRPTSRHEWRRWQSAPWCTSRPAPGPYWPASAPRAWRTWLAAASGVPSWSRWLRNSSWRPFPPRL